MYSIEYYLESVLDFGRVVKIRLFYTKSWGNYTVNKFIFPNKEHRHKSFKNLAGIPLSSLIGEIKKR
jgi:hypothetical protein